MGGGLGALKEFKSVGVREGDDELEALVIEIEICKLKIRCVNGYGPQNYDSAEKKLKFWSFLDAEVRDANKNGAGFICQMDGNLWAGPNIVKGDPHEQNANGKMLDEFLSNNPHLTVVNSLEICEGTITRERKTVNGVEKSVLDFFIVCSRIVNTVKKMKIDEAKENALSSYKESGKQVKESDHNVLILQLAIDFKTNQTKRVQVLNLRNQNNLNIFKEHLSNTNDLMNCFNGKGNVKKIGKKWFQILKTKIGTCFKKVRITKKKSQTKTQTLMKKKSELRKKMKRSTREQQKALHDEIEKIDMCIGEEIAEENRKNVENNFALLSRTDGSVNVNGMWKMKNRMFPRHPVGMPTVKKNAEGKLVTSQEELLTLYKETFIHRLRHRPIREEYSDIFELKMKLCKERLIYSERNKSQSWTEEQFIKILQNLKNNKCRDPHGLVNEIFKLKNIGVDLFNSLFELLNRIKTELMIPNFMKYTDIHTVYKGKGERSSLENQRGIFIVNIFILHIFILHI